MRTFIVRPFRIKKGIDFEKVDAELIQPALKQCGIRGGTTAEIMTPGNIREDMFQRLLTAELVVADITLHNANVYYELGIRHALRDRSTILLRAQEDGALAPDAVPFDLLTDRYLTYPVNTPADAVPQLAQAITQALAQGGRDSPVFKLLPKLRAPSSDDFLAVPVDFEEDLEKAAVRAARPENADQRTLLSGDLALLAFETKALPWANAALRLIGRRQFHSKHYEGARLTWEEMRRRGPMDLEANLKLATICQKLGDLEASNFAIDRALKHQDLPLDKRAEGQCLKASNLKVQWLGQLQALETEERGPRALSSGLLADAVAAYEEGFKADRNHYYAGINALALRTVQRGLAQRLPDVWESIQVDVDGIAPVEQAKRELKQIEVRIDRLVAGVELALESAAVYGSPDDSVWRAYTRADLVCLTSDKPDRVYHAYQQVNDRYKDTHAFALSSAQAQLKLLQCVGVLKENAEAGLAAFPPISDPPAKDRSRILLFTGHRVDDLDRTKKGKRPRFPRTRKAEELAAEEIAARIDRALKSPYGVALAIAGGASGGDILFHEAANARGIPTWLYLALPPARYKNESVRSADGDWDVRFDKIEHASGPHHRLMHELKSEGGHPEELPRWLKARPEYNVWQRSNLWMLYNALAFGPDRVTLVALWDGQAEGDGPGGTSHLVATARECGAEVDIIDSNKLFGC